MVIVSSPSLHLFPSLLVLFVLSSVFLPTLCVGVCMCICMSVYVCQSYFSHLPSFCLLYSSFFFSLIPEIKACYKLHRPLPILMPACSSTNRYTYLYFLHKTRSNLYSSLVCPLHILYNKTTSQSYPINGYRYTSLFYWMQSLWNM